MEIRIADRGDIPGITKLIEASEAAAREEGFNRFELMAILSGIDFYERVGYKKMEPVEIPLEDGVVIEAVRMVKD
jgi:predicted N-acetyltransferase YhbS